MLYVWKIMRIVIIGFCILTCIVNGIFTTGFGWGIFAHVYNMPWLWWGMLASVALHLCLVKILNKFMPGFDDNDLIYY